MSKQESKYVHDPLLIRRTSDEGELITGWYEPKEDHWYVGVTHDEKFGAVAKFVSGHFRNSTSRDPIDMSRYVYLIERPLKVVPPAGASPLYHLRNLGDAVDQLYTLIKSPTVPWNDGQKANALEILSKAQQSLLTLTQREADSQIKTQ